MDEFIGHSAADFMEPKFQSDFASRYLEMIKNQKFHEGISCYVKKTRKRFILNIEVLWSNRLMEVIPTSAVLAGMSLKKFYLKKKLAQTSKNK